MGGASRLVGQVGSRWVRSSRDPELFRQTRALYSGNSDTLPAFHITAESTDRHLAAGLVIGMRFHSAPVIRLADAKPVQLGHAGAADGRWRIYAFAGAGDPAAPRSGVRILCDFLANAPESPVKKYTPSTGDIDSVIDVRAVFQQSHHDLAIEAMPAFLLPRKGRYGLRDYEKMFCPDLKSGHDIFAMRGIDREQGCMIVVRPDQYIAHVLPLDGHMQLAEFFDGFMVRRHAVSAQPARALSA